MSRIVHFPPFELRPTTRSLLRNGQPVPLGARALDLLMVLVDARGALVTKEQLLQRVWPGLVVEEANVHVQVSLLRKVLGTGAIATVPGLGYRFAWPIGEGGGEHAVPHNLPAERTAFVGREADVSAAVQGLGAARWLTLAGIGGTGKTRLALRAARAAMPRFPDGVWWVDLAGIDEGGRLAPAIARATACPVSDEAQAEQALADHLKERRSLLVLDNCEHLLDAVATQGQLLLQACAGLTVLATSREAIALPGERVLPVRPLALPTSDAAFEALEACESVQLFVQAAIRAHPEFVLEPGNASSVAELCREVDGLPLALELAASQMQVIAPAQLLGLLRDRFRALGGPRRALARQATLRAVIQWSWEHLSPGEQTLLSALAVCAGGSDLETLQALMLPEAGGADAGLSLLGGLARLSDLSLITVTHRGAVARYRLLETVAQFALEQMGDRPGRLLALRHAHLDHFVMRTARWAAAWNGPDPAATLREADDEQANGARALDWALACGRWLDALRLAHHLFPWWTARSGAVHALETFERVFEAVPPHATDPLVAEVLCHAASVALRRGLPERARALAERGARRADASDALSARLDARIMLARVDERQGRLDDARARLDPVIVQARQQGLDKVLGDALNVLGQVQLEQKDVEGARVSFEESAQQSQRAGHLYDIAIDQLCLAIPALESGDAAQARHWMRAAAPLLTQVDHRYVEQMWLDLSAWVAAVEGDWRRAVESFRLADRFAASLQHGRSDHWRRVSGESLAHARAALGDAAWEAACVAGEAAPLQDAVARATAWVVGERGG